MFPLRPRPPSRPVTHVAHVCSDSTPLLLAKRLKLPAVEVVTVRPRMSKDAQCAPVPASAVAAAAVDPLTGANAINCTYRPRLTYAKKSYVTSTIINGETLVALPNEGETFLSSHRTHSDVRQGIPRNGGRGRTKVDRDAFERERRGEIEKQREREREKKNARSFLRGQNVPLSPPVRVALQQTCAG